MSHGIVTAAYIVAAIFFIFSLAGLSRQESAKNGNVFGIVVVGALLQIGHRATASFQHSRSSRC